MNLISLLGLTSGVLTILGVSLRDVPFVRQNLARIRLPYQVWKIVFIKRQNLLYLPRQETKNQVIEADRLLYSLHGLYKMLGIASSRIDLLGYPQQFRHTLVEYQEIETSLQQIYARYLPKLEYQQVYKIIKLWSPYLHAKFDSRIIEVIQTSTLVELGYEIPVGNKLELLSFIRDFYIGKYFAQGKRSFRYLEDLISSLEYLLPEEKQAAYTAQYLKLHADIKQAEIFENFLEFTHYLNTVIELIETNFKEAFMNVHTYIQRANSAGIPLTFVDISLYMRLYASIQEKELFSNKFEISENKDPKTLNNLYNKYLENREICNA